MKTETLTLPSGMMIEMKQPTLVESYAARKALPDLGSTGKAEVSDDDGLATALMLVAMCAVKPRLWFDPAEPMSDPPPDRIALANLAMGDQLALLKWINDASAAMQASVVPLATTAPP